MPLSGKGSLRLASAWVVLMVAGLGGAARAAPTAPDQFPLGQSPRSGSVCQAVRNDDAPGAQVRGARAWDVRCRGFDVPLGTLYAYSYKPDKMIEPGGPWVKTLTAHAQCSDAKSATLAGLHGVTQADCKAFSAKVAYAAYVGSAHGRAVTAEGYVQIADVLETGLRVVAGVIPPPKATQELAAASAASLSAHGDGGLAEAAEAAATAPENLRERGYNRNISWGFADAETDFRSLAQDQNAGDQLRAEAYLNWALNASNTGNFDQAKVLFAAGNKLAGSDQGLRGLSLSYRALDYRNQRRFKDSVAAAEAARAMFSSLQPAVKNTDVKSDLQAGPGGDVVIGPDAASALKDRASDFGSSSIDLATRVRVQVAQVDLTEATSFAALGDSASARRLLEESSEILAEPALIGVATWLRAEVNAELARQDELGGRPEQARALLNEALFQLRLRQAGSPAEAFLLMQVARLDALAGRKDLAMAEFREAITLFRETRGSLGSSADSAAVYLDLLIAQSKSDPSHAGDYAQEFSVAVQSLGGASTAQIVAQLAARLDRGGSAAAGLIRALEDTRRQVRVKESTIAELQSQNAYTPAIKTVSEVELKSLNEQATTLEQQVAAVDPRYGQLVATDVSLKDLQGSLKPGELYVKVVLLSSQGYVLAVTTDKVTPYRIELGQAAAAQQVQTLRRPFETAGYLPSYNVEKSYALFKTLFGPIQDQVLQAKAIIYEPDPTLLSLPIAALAMDQTSVDLIASRHAAIRAKGEGVLSYDGVHWLGQASDMSLVVSAASFVQARNFPASAAKHAFLGMGDSVQPAASDPKAYASVVNWGGAGQADADVCQATREALLALKPLKEASLELKTVGASIDASDAEIVTGAAFNDGAIGARTDLDQYRVVYFATHGLLPKPGGCLPEPALLTSVGDAESDGLLSASKILKLKLDADLVVLSACDTGGGGGVDAADLTGLGGAGEALSGLTRAFIYAGARSLIVSHWSIDSDATVRLMTSMFASGAPTQSGAMRAAALSLMSSKDQYSHPYYWAAFTVVGDGARPMPLR